MKGSIKTRELNDGSKRYDCIWRSPTGQQKWKSFHRRKDAENFLIKTVRSIHDGSYQDLQPMLMSQVFDRWLSDLDTQVKCGRPKPSTASSYKHIVRHYFTPAFGEVRSDQLSADVMGAFTKTLAQRIGEGTLKPKTFNNVIVLLRSILKWARRSDQRYLRHDPMEYIKKMRKTQTEREILQPNELWSLLVVAEATRPDDTIVKTFAFTGLRRGEVFGLQWRDLHVSPGGREGCLHVQRAIVMGQVSTVKTDASVRVLDIPQGLVEELLLYKVTYPPMGAGWIFRTATGGFRHPENWYKRNFIPLTHRAGLKPIGLHVLRHTYVSLLVAQGESAKYISRQVGHSTIAMTMDTYAHLFSQGGGAKLGRIRL